MTAAYIDLLISIGACRDAVEWCRGHPTLEAAWAVCERGEWMLWLLGRLDRSKPWSDERKPLIACVVECAALAPEAGEDYELARQWCLDATERWTRGEADRDEVEAARLAALDAAADGSAYHSAPYANATYCAAVAASGALAVRCSYVTTDAAYIAAASDPRVGPSASVLAECADIVRRHFPKPPKLSR
jgi:hypothetical protein